MERDVPKTITMCASLKTNQQKPSDTKEQTSSDTAVESDVSQTVHDSPRRLHVTYIPFRFREDDLLKLFESFGDVNEVEIIYNERGSKGYGFVTMARGVDAIKARDALNGKEVEGRKIEVNNATPRAHSSAPGRGKGQRGRTILPLHYNGYSRQSYSNGYHSYQAEDYMSYGRGYSGYSPTQAYSHGGYSQHFAQHANNSSGGHGYVHYPGQGSGYGSYRQGTGNYRYQPY